MSRITVFQEYAPDRFQLCQHCQGRLMRRDMLNCLKCKFPLHFSSEDFHSAFKWFEMLHVNNLNPIYSHIDPWKSHANGISCAQVKWTILAAGKNFTAHKWQMDGWTMLTPGPLLLGHSSSSITQPLHEYKWRPVKSSDWVPVNGFLLGLRQQHSPNGFSLTGFNHVPWYPLKRMQIVNQTSLLPSCFPISCCCCCRPLIPHDHLAIIHLAYFQFYSFLLQPFTY